MKIELKKIHAFTLSEMLVALLITTIVVGMAFSVLNLIQKQMQGIEGNYERNTELNLLRQSLWIDFNRSNRIGYDEGKQELYFFNEIKSVTYQLYENQIIKEKDTFHLQWEVQKFYFENSAISTGEIDALEFKTSKAYGNRPLFVYKTNSANLYMNP